jgi:hypothetical protein
LPFLLFNLGMMAFNAYGQWKQGQATKRAGESQAQVAEATAKLQDFNAGVADAQARDAVTRGEGDVGRLAEQTRGLIGAQRAGYAGQGVVVDTGSAAAVQADAQQLSDSDQRMIRANAQRQAWGFRVDAENSRRQAGITRQGGEIARKEGQAAARAATIGAIGTIVGGVGSMALQRYGWDKPTTTSSSTSAPVGPQLSQNDVNYIRRQSPTLMPRSSSSVAGYQGDALAGYRNAA